MKHRSVIAFVIVAAALFSLPQLSHDLSALKGAVGARLHSELLHAFLNLPAGEPSAAVPAARPAHALLASCTREKAGAPAARPGRADAGRRAEGRATEKGSEQRAMIGDPLNDPVVRKAVAEVEVVTEVAMIIPPDGGIDPRRLADTFASSEVARVEAGKLRAEADGLRVAYAAARFAANGPEWQKSTEEALRKFDAQVPGAYELRVVREGAKARVVKLKCGDCPAPALRLPRAPRPTPSAAPLPAPVVPVDTISE